MLAVTKWKHFLMAYHFIIKTDHQSLKFLLEQRLTSTLQHKCLAKLLGMDYEIQYKKEVENVVADVLSRKGWKAVEDDSEPQEAQVCAILSVQLQWLEEEIRNTQYLAVQPDSIPDYKHVGGIIRYKGKIYIGNSNGVREQIMEALHASAFGGHSGQLGSTQRIGFIFHWPMVKQDIVKYVQQCDDCQRNKHENLPYPCLLQPLSIPQQVWTHVNMDFVESLLMSEGCNAILVVVDRLSKIGHFIALSHPFSAKNVAQSFMDNVFKLHGVPK